MRLAHFNRRVVFGQLIAIPLVAIGPLVAAAQNANMRAAPNGYPTAESPATGYRDANATPPQRESLFGDQGIRWPKMPFSRSKAPEKPKTAYQLPPSGRTMPNAAQGQRMAARQSNRTNMPPRTPMARSQGAPSNSNLAPRPAMNQMARPNAAPQRVAARPLTPPTPMAMPSNISSAPKASPQSPAIGILAQAHDLSTTAKTENDFSRIIDACRQAQAGQTNPQISRYTNELASWALNRRGQIKAEAGRDQEALADFDAAVQADDTRWRAIHNRGVLLAQSGEFEKAFDDFSRTIQTNPKFAKAYSNRGALFVVAGNIQPALQDYNQAIALDPELAVAHRGLGRACHLDGQLDAAIEHYDEAVRLSPNDSYAIASRADVLTDLGQYAEAALEYERAIKTDPNSGHAHSGSAWLLATCPDASIRNPKLAIERAKIALEITGGDDAASLDTLAAAQANSGNFAAAERTVQQAVRLASDSEKESYQERLSLYQQEKPYRLEAIEEVVQISHQE